MNAPYYQIDAFTSELFSGNPAGVCLLDAWIEDSLLQAIAMENNLSETAFLVPATDGYEIRWFTPKTEVALCGHATLASGFVVFEYRAWPWAAVRFHSRQNGPLSVHRSDGHYWLDFPARPPFSRQPPPGLSEALGVEPQEVHGSEEDWLILLEDERQVRELNPDFKALAALDGRGVIVTAAGKPCDFVSRFFAPRVGVPEDPVTGSAHCVLIPFWSARLGKKTLHARQLSRRGGELFCEDRGDRVQIGGHATAYLQGEIYWPS